MKITDEFRCDGELRTAMDAKPRLLVERSAKGYVERLAPGGEMLVGVKPEAPESSVVRETDQRPLPKGLPLDN